MAAFGLEVTKEEANVKLIEIKTRLMTNDFIKNPFSSKMVKRGKDFYVVCIEPVYPRFYLFAVFPLLIWLLFPKGAVGVIAAIIFFAMAFIGLWWWDKFYFLLFKMATKNGVKYVSAEETLKRVV